MTVTKFLKTLEFGRKSVQSHTKPTDELGKEKKNQPRIRSLWLVHFPQAQLGTGPGDLLWLWEVLQRASF